MVNRMNLTDTSGKPLTQGLFLEIGYGDSAIYTLKDDDHDYNGRVLLSIKRLYLEMEDVTEYEFANKYFLGWSHWQRICNNKVLRKYIDDWRVELELKLRARAAKLMIDQASSGSYQAVKWLADRGWDVKKAGRPTKEDVESEKKAMAKIESEYGSDVVRLFGDN